VNKAGVLLFDLRFATDCVVNGKTIIWQYLEIVPIYSFTKKGIH